MRTNLPIKSFQANYINIKLKDEGRNMIRKDTELSHDKEVVKFSKIATLTVRIIFKNHRI
ncbi:MAG: hypothetical protein NTX65_14955 [Ignavibacteriales bacterium]|nr:hypothetical protein [Ignavibacteriales bacterium]